MEMSPLTVEGSKILAYARRSGLLSREGSLSFNTYCDTGPWLFRSHQSPFTTREGIRRTYSYPDPHGGQGDG